MTKCDKCSPVNFLHIFKTPFLKNASEGLPLYFKHQNTKSFEINPIKSNKIDSNSYRKEKTNPKHEKLKL